MTANKMFYISLVDDFSIQSQSHTNSLKSVIILGQASFIRFPQGSAGTKPDRSFKTFLECICSIC